MSATTSQPREWTLWVCDCGSTSTLGPCTGFPGAWNEDRSDFNRGACMAEAVKVREVAENG